ncbi:MAG: hypothetical protein ACRDI1_09785 [Actinomycetota bacterium]
MLAMSVLLTACVAPGSRRVGLKSLAADLVFGIPPLEEPVAPPDTVPDTTPTTDIDGPPPLPLDNRGAIAGGVQAAGCPDATTNEVKVQAGDNVIGKPAEGEYRWRIEGFDILPAPIGKINSSGFFDREILDVRDLEGEGDFEFGFGQESDGTRVVQYFQVIQSRPDPRTGPNIVRDEGATNGIFLVRIEQQREKQRPRVFMVNPPILYLPLPVIIGFERETHAADPSSQQLLSHSIHVVNRERYNACGVLVDSWFVDGEQSFSSTEETFQRDYNYSVAPQMGGMFVFEHVERCTGYTEPGSCERAGIEGTEVYDATIGQVEPD